jgi:iduronate 2-sulfatase
MTTPGMNKPGTRSKGIVELLDIFPTLCELTGLPRPTGLEGKSIAPLLKNADADWNEVALTQYPNPALREWAANPLSNEMRETFFGPLIKEVEGRIKNQMGEKWDRDFFEEHLMAYALRTNRYRYIEWRDHRDPKSEPIFTELYDHENDPKETTNIAHERPSITLQLGKKMRPMIKRKFPF